ncbi:MAG TPA: hypothetical protein VFK80_04285, partial [Limnochordia bacterium]|nr:hypothetical protein [Limnochordia bacterium]
PTKSGVAAAAFMRETPGLMDFADVMVKFGRPVPSYPSPGHLDDVLNQAIANAVKGRLTPQAALSAAAVQFRTAIGK